MPPGATSSVRTPLGLGNNHKFDMVSSSSLPIWGKFFKEAIACILEEGRVQTQILPDDLTRVILLHRERQPV